MVKYFPKKIWQKTTQKLVLFFQNTQHLMAFIFGIVLIPSNAFPSNAFSSQWDVLLSGLNLGLVSPSSIPTGSLGAIAIKDGKIARIGTPAALESGCVSPCKIVRYTGTNYYAVPGLHDSHAHQISGGAQYFRLKVSGSSVSSIQSAIRKYSSENPQLQWIIGRGWNAAGFGGRYPTRFDLDAAEKNKPVVLLDMDGHNVWANSAAIIAAGITRETKDPTGGTIIRDAQGEPQGVFLENAGDLLYAKAPETLDEELDRWILKGDDVGIKNGVSITQGGPVSLRTMKRYAELEKKNLLKQKVYLWASLDALEDVIEDAPAVSSAETSAEISATFASPTPEETHAVPNAEASPVAPSPSEKYISELLSLNEKLNRENSKVKITAIKGFVDGVISSYTAALKHPYHDHPETVGTPVFEQEKLNRLVLKANQLGFPVALHAIGDRAVSMSLNAFEESKKILQHSLVNRIEHIELVDPKDAKRFKELNVAAAMQPSHMYFGSLEGMYYPQRLGWERMQHTFPWNELRQNGALLLFGTDYPVVSQDPIQSFFCATQRKLGNGYEYYPLQKVNQKTALDAWTINPAIAMAADQSIGSLQVGKSADITVFDRHPFLSGDYLGNLNIKLVMIDGKIFLQ